MVQSIFADTVFWIALFSKKDDFHEKAKAILDVLPEYRIITSQMVLTELLDAFAERGEHLRRAVTEVVDDILEDENTEVVEQTSDGFYVALELYKARNDKGWGITDCSSIIILQNYGINEVLTYDQHFVQAGYVALLRQ